MTKERAEERLRRLLAMIPWVEAQGTVAVEEVCSRFGFSEQELQEELELLFVCGVHPYQPDDLIYAEVVDGHVSIAYADWFRRPLRLTPAQGLVLVTAAEALLSVPGTDPDGPLSRALDKIASVLGVEPGAAPAVELGDVDAGALAALQRAVSEHRCAVIDHYSFGADRWAERTIEPWLVFSSGGAWYVRAWCRTAVAERLFRIDRISDVRLLTEQFAPPSDPGTPTVYEARPDDPVVELEVDEEARWVAAQYPNEGVTELGDGRLRVRLAVSERAWLERLLLGLGERAAVVDGPAELRSAGAAAAARLLARYR